MSHTSRQKAYKWLPDAIRQHRLHADRYLSHLVDRGIIKDIKGVKVVPLTGGEVSTCFLVYYDTGPVVVKFTHLKPYIEIEAFDAWRRQGVSVPGGMSCGVVQDARGSTIYYVIMEGILGSGGRPAETGSRLLARSPNISTLFGTILGEELSRMHRIATDHPFTGGPFSRGVLYLTWKDFLKDQVQGGMDKLALLGLEREELSAILVHVQKDLFPQRGVYAHGDFDAENTLVESEDPLRIRIIDPNICIADPYWDLARISSTQQFHAVLYEVDPKHKKHKERFRTQSHFTAALESYARATGEIDELRLLCNMLVLMMKKYRYKEKKIRAELAYASSNRATYITMQLQCYEKALLRVAKRLAHYDGKL